MSLRVVIIVCLLFAASACTSNAPRTDSAKVEGVSVFTTDATGQNLVLVSGEASTKRKMKCRTEIPTGSHIPKKVCYWEDDLKRAGEDARNVLDTFNRSTGPNQ